MPVCASGLEGGRDEGSQLMYALYSKETNVSSGDYSYGAVIRERRVALGLTQRQVAHQCGITDSALAHFERELRVPSESVASRIADVLGLEDEQRSAFEKGLKATRDRQSRERVRSRAVGRRKVVGHEPDAQELARYLADDPVLLECCRDLQRALSKPGQRQAIRRALKAWAADET